MLSDHIIPIVVMLPILLLQPLLAEALKGLQIPLAPKLPSRRNVTLIDAQEFEDWVIHQSHHAFESILGNVGHPRSTNGLPDGVVIASPSSEKPDYYYQWIRDSAITMDSVVRQFWDQARQGTLNQTLSDTISSYITVQGALQRVRNPSGYFEWDKRIVTGLGEPKFEIDNSAFSAHWGRPQNDGPALRISTITHFIKSQLEWNSTAVPGHYQHIYESIILPDVEYILQHWDKKTFDLWEELEGFHLFTSQAQFNALANAVELSRLFQDRITERRCTFTAGSIRQFIKASFYDSSRLVAYARPRDFSRSGLDSSIFLAALDTVRWPSCFSDMAIAPYDDLLIGTILPYITSFDYLINNDRKSKFEPDSPGYIAGGLGRYAEDVYDGVGTSEGNPWFICTATIAEILYYIAQRLVQQPPDFVLETNEVSQEFYSLFSTKSRVSRSSEEFKLLLQGLVDLGDSFLDVIREHHAHNGDMSEQFNKYTGYMQGAEKLTWSYGSFWSAVKARSETLDMIKDGLTGAY